MPSGPRLWLVNAVLLIVLGGSLFAIVAADESWPFCSYQMFSYVRGERSLVRYRLYGVNAASGVEIPLRESRFIDPFDPSRLHRAFSRMDAKPGRAVLFRDALSGCFARYEELRRAGRHEGPPLRGIRLYRLEWRLKPDAANRDWPDRKELLSEWPIR